MVKTNHSHLNCSGCNPPSNLPLFCNFHTDYWRTTSGRGFSARLRMHQLVFNLRLRIAFQRITFLSQISKTCSLKFPYYNHMPELGKYFYTCKCLQHLPTSVRPSVGPSVGPSIGPSVGQSVGQSVRHTFQFPLPLNIFVQQSS